MSAYAIDLELVEELVARMATFEGHLDDVVSDVTGRARRVHAVWRGAAAAESADAHARWNAAAQDMHEALGVLRSIASTARANYAAALRANTQMWAL